jgi:hypothetical protein
MKNINKILKVSEELYKKSLWSYFFYKKAARVVEYVPSSSGGQSMGYYSGGYDEGEESLQKYSYNENNPQSILNSGAKELLNDLSPSEFKNKLNELVNSFETCTNLFEQADRKDSFSDEDIGVIRRLSNNFFENYKKVIADNYHQSALIQDWKENVDVAEAGRVIKDMYEFVEIKSRSYVSTLFSDLIEEYEDSISSGEDPGEIEDSIGEIFESKSEEQEAQAEQKTEGLLNRRRESSGKSKKKYLKKIKEYRPLTSNEKVKLQSMMEEIQKNPQAKFDIIRKYKDEAEAKNQLFIMKDYHQSYLNLLAQQRASKKNRIERLKRESLEGNIGATEELLKIKKMHLESNKDYFNWEKLFNNLGDSILNILGLNFKVVLDSLGKISGKNSIDKQIEGLKNIKNILENIPKENAGEERIQAFEAIINIIEDIQLKQILRKEISSKEVEERRGHLNISEEEKGATRKYPGMRLPGYVQGLEHDLSKSRFDVKESVEGALVKLISEKITDPSFISTREKAELLEGKKLTAIEKKQKNILTKLMEENIKQNPEFIKYKKLIENITKPIQIKKIEENLKNANLLFKESIRALRDEINKDILLNNEDKINEICKTLKIDINFSLNKKKEEINRQINLLEGFIDQESEVEKNLLLNLKKLKEELKNKIKEEARSYNPIKDIARSTVAYKNYAKFVIKIKLIYNLEEKIERSENLNQEEKNKIEEIITNGSEILKIYGSMKYFQNIENSSRKTQFYKMNTTIDILLKYLRGFLSDQIVILSPEDVETSFAAMGYEKAKKR